jgi:paraquat-inducible protein B
MAARTNHWKLGLFVASGAVVLLLIIGGLGAAIMHRAVGKYVSYFDESVQGLDVGSPIKFRGVTIGTVGAINVAPDHRHVEVESDLGIAELTRLGLDVAPGPVLFGARKRLQMAPDLRVQLTSSGITGVKFLQLDFFDVAENPPPVLPFPVPENYIPAADSTMKNIEDSLVRAIRKLPELADQASSMIQKIDGILGDVDEKHLPARAIATLDHVDAVLGVAREKIAQVDTRKLSAEAERTLAGLTQTMNRLSGLLSDLTGDKGLIASVTRTADALGDTAVGARGVGNDLEEALAAVRDAARSVHGLAQALEQTPDMLLKGRSRGPEKNR